MVVVVAAVDAEAFPNENDADDEAVVVAAVEAAAPNVNVGAAGPELAEAVVVAEAAAAVPKEKDGGCTEACLVLSSGFLLLAKL